MKKKDFSNFDVDAELAILIARTEDAKNVPYRPSKIDILGKEVLDLYEHGASKKQLLLFLEDNNIDVVHSTLSRWLNKNG